MSALATPSVLPHASKSSRGLHISLWVAQVALAFAFLGAGATKLFTPMEALAKDMGWIVGTPEALVRFIALAELTGALGLILPSLTRIKPFLTGLAGVGLATNMVLAAGVHLVRGETFMLPINFTLGAVAAFIAWGRLKKAPIAPRA